MKYARNEKIEKNHLHQKKLFDQIQKSQTKVADEPEPEYEAEIEDLPAPAGSWKDCDANKRPEWNKMTKR